MKKNNG